MIKCVNDLFHPYPLALRASTFPTLPSSKDHQEIYEMRTMEWHFINYRKLAV